MNHLPMADLNSGYRIDFVSCFLAPDLHWTNIPQSVIDVYLEHFTTARIDGTMEKFHVFSISEVLCCLIISRLQTECDSHVTKHINGALDASVDNVSEIARAAKEKNVKWKGWCVSRNSLALDDDELNSLIMITGSLSGNVELTTTKLQSARIEKLGRKPRGLRSTDEHFIQLLKRQESDLSSETVLMFVLTTPDSGGPVQLSQIFDY